MVITASFFHRSALIFIPCYFLGNLKISDSRILLFYITSIVIGTMGILNEVLFNFITNYIIGIDDTVSSKLGTILTDNYFDRKRQFLADLISIVNSLFFIILFLIYKRKNTKNKYFYSFFILYIVGLIFIRIFVGPLSEFARFGNYFSFLIYILFSFSLEGMTGLRKISFSLFFVLFCFLKLRESHSQFNDLYEPYFSVFEDHQRPVY
jgi:hypothetical protein